MSEQITSKQAIEVLYRLYANDVFRFALHSLGNRSDALDVVQEVFYRAYKGWNSFRQDAQPRTWLFQITRNYITDSYRRKNKEEAYRQGCRASQCVNETDSNIDLKNAISRLKESYRYVIVLRFIQDLSVEDTARILGWTPGKVRTTQLRALQVLRSVLAEEDVTSNKRFVKGGEKCE